MRAIETEYNTIKLSGDFGETELKAALGAFHNLTDKQGYKDITVDLSNITKVLAPDFLPLCAYIRKQLHNGIDTRYIPPKDPKLSRLMTNTNWAYLIDPRENSKTNSANKNHLPALIYRNSEEHFEAVDSTINILLASINSLSKGQLAALEWAINEITDNVLNHSQSPIGGVMQVTTRQKGRFVEFVVCDAGIGIPKSLKDSHPDIPTDQQALDKAIREGVTRNKTTNMGNGLYGSYRIAQLSGGNFKIYSGYARLAFTQKNGLHVSAQTVPYNGTLISCTIDCSNPKILEEALVFKNKPYKPSYSYFDRINDSEKITIKILDETSSFGSRGASEPVRIKIQNILANSAAPIEINMSGIELISSSFADEIFGKIFVELGPLTFMQRIQITGTAKIVSQLIDRAMHQRMSMQ